MKRFLALMLAMVMLLALFAGCKKDEGSKDPAGKPGEVPMKDGKKARTDIVICDGFDVVTFDPAEITDVYSSVTAQLLYDRLVKLDEKGFAVPMLATEWTVPDDSTYIFKLTKGVKFHNGDEMTANDVVFSLLRAQANPKSYTNFEMIDTVEAVDDYTVKVTTKGPFAPILLKLATNNASILSQKYVEGIESSGGKYGEKPIGTGCMTLTHYKPNESVKMTRFDDYWDGVVRATTITRRVIPEESSRTIALENGEVDYIDSLPSVDVNRCKANSDLKVVEMPSSSVAYIGLNFDNPKFKDKRVRQALHYAINKDNIVEVQFEGYGEPSTSVFPTMNPGFDPDLDLYPFNPEKAKQLMIAAGMEQGFKFEIIVSSELRSRISQLIQQDYKAINVDLEISIVEFGTVLELTASGNFEAFLLGWSNATDPDSTVMSNFHSSKIGAAGNRVRINNPQVDKLIDAARTELDWNKRYPMYKEMQKILMDECAWIPLLQQTTVSGMLAGTDGVEMYPTGARWYRNMVVYE